MSLRGNIALAACAGIFGMTLASGVGIGLAMIYAGFTGLTFATAFALHDAANAPIAVARAARRHAVAPVPAPAVVVAPAPWYRTWVNPFAGLFRPAPMVRHGATHTRRFAAGGHAPVPPARVYTPAARHYGGGAPVHTRHFVGGGAHHVPAGHQPTHTRTFVRR